MMKVVHDLHADDLVNVSKGKNAARVLRKQPERAAIAVQLDPS